MLACGLSSKDEFSGKFDVEKLFDSSNGYVYGTEEINKQTDVYTETERPKIFSPQIPVRLDMGLGTASEDDWLSEIRYLVEEDSSIPYEYGNSPEEQQEIQQLVNDYGATEEYHKIDKMTCSYTNATVTVVTVERAVRISQGIPTGDYQVEEILSLLRDSSGNVVEYADLYHSDTGAGELLENGAEMLFQLLDSSENTEGLADVMRYILYRYNGKDYGVTVFDYGILGEITFTGIGGIIRGSSIQEKVWYALKSLGYSDISIAAAMGNIHYESGSFDPTKVEGGYNEYNGGIGICQWTNNSRGATGRNQQLRDYAASKGKTWQDEDVQVEFLVAELGGGGAADAFADYQLMNPSYTAKRYNYNDWKNAEDEEELDEAKLKDLTEIFCFTFERPNESAGLSSLNTRLTWAKYYYGQFHGKSLAGGTEVVTGDDAFPKQFTSNITGRTHSVNRQRSPIINLPGMCHLSAAATIASGYKKDGETDMDVINRAKNCGGYILSNETVSNQFFNYYGLKAEVDKQVYSTLNIRNIMSQGKYIAIWLNGSSVGSELKGKSGSAYTMANNVHWVAVLGYDYNNGDEQIYVADPGNRSSGWKDIDEFDDIKRYIGHFTVVSEM